MNLLLRTASNPTGYVSAVRDVVRQTDPAIAVRSVNTLEEEIADSIAIETHPRPGLKAHGYRAGDCGSMRRCD